MDVSPKDAEKLKVKSGDRMSVSSARGRIDDVVVRVTGSVREGSVFVPFHFNEQLINRLTNESFCPKSGEPNFKQTAIQLHSKELPDGLSIKKTEISGEIAHQKTAYEGVVFKAKNSVTS